MALRTLVYSNSHEGMLAKHKEVDQEELKRLASFLEGFNMTAKQENQIKSEVCQAINAFLSRSVLRARVDNDMLRALEKVLQEQLYSKLAKVRTSSKSLLAKLQNPSCFEAESKQGFQSVTEPPTSISQDRLYIDLRNRTITQKPPENTGKITQKPADFMATFTEKPTEVFKTFTENPDEARPEISSELAAEKNEGRSPDNVETKGLSKVGPNNLFQEKRDQVKMNKLKEDHSDSPELKRGLFVIEDSLLEMTKGKGWGPNIRAKNYLKRHLINASTENLSIEQQRVAKMKENMEKQRTELRYKVGKSKSQKRLGFERFSGINEDAERKRLKRLEMIKKGLNPDTGMKDEQMLFEEEIIQAGDNNANMGGVPPKKKPMGIDKCSPS